MGAIVQTMSVSLDGYMAAPDGGLEWNRIDEELHQHFNDWIGASSLSIDGRVTYELMQDYWPTADQDPEAEPIIVEFAEIWRNSTKYVFSRTVDDFGPEVTVLSEVDPDQIRALASSVDGDVVVGGAILGEAFRALDLIDEYRVYVHPVIIGRGLPMFHPADVWADLELIETHTFATGVVLLHYRRVSEPAE